METTESAEATLEERVKDTPETREERREDTPDNDADVKDNSAYKRASSKSRAGLKKTVEQLEEEADRLGIDRTEYISDYFAKSGKKKGTRTIHGSVAIICYENPKTGQVELFLEINKDDYALPEERGKIRPIGGAMDAEDHGNHYTTMKRELKEEIGGNWARGLLLEEFERNPKLYAVHKQKINGEEARTNVYEIKYLDEALWNIVNKTHSADDAGHFKNFKLEEILAKSPNDFASGYAPIIKNLAIELLERSIQNRNANYPNAYSFSASGNYFSMN